MIEAGPRREDRERAYWLALRGAQQMDLAERFSAAAAARGTRILALKGISIAEVLYGGPCHRPMADIDLLVVDRSRFEDACRLARELGLIEIGGADYDVVFREPGSGVLLELHLSLTSCPGLFTIDYPALWNRRAAVPGSAFSRLGDVDLVIHLALHTAFQHGFAAGRGHFEDFVRVIDRLRPPGDEVVARAREWGASKAFAAMARLASRKYPESSRLAALTASFASCLPSGLSRWIDGLNEEPGAFGVASLARVRYELAPSKSLWLWRSLAPRAAPGQTLPPRGRLKRLIGLLESGLGPAIPSGAGRP